MITVRITFQGGNFIVSGFNGTLEDARSYYKIGTQFNVGRGENDYLETVESIELEP